MSTIDCYFAFTIMGCLYVFVGYWWYWMHKDAKEADAWIKKARGKNFISSKDE
jgi:hypothetical protein